MERKEIILRNLIQIAKRYESEHTGLLAWEIPSVRDAEKWLEELRKPDVIKSVCSLCKKEIEVNRESNIFCDECWKIL